MYAMETLVISVCSRIEYNIIEASFPAGTIDNLILCN